MKAHSFTNSEELLKGLRDGDEKCYAAIFKMYWYELYRTAIGKVHSHELAEEIVQDIFLKLWEKRASHQIMDIRGYLYTCLTNKCIDYIRKDHVFKKYWQQSQAFFEAYANSAEDTVISSELNKALRTGISSLPDKTRKVLVLSKYFGLSIREISEKIKLSEKTVEYHLTKSIKSLRIHLRDFILLALLFIDL